MNRTTRRAALLLLASTAMVACHKKPKPQPEPVAPTTPQPVTPRVNQDSIDAAARAAAARRDSIAAAENARRLAETRNTLLATVYFDYDQSAVRDDAKAALDAKLPILNANPNLRVRIAGHTDNRGSDEYNLALGQKRAAETKRYLTQHGIDDSRIEIVSFGEERPAAQGENEDAWSKNRRSEFEIIAGGDTMTLPR
jgi:peptidoglycan-associated lipoprotein